MFVSCQNPSAERPTTQQGLAGMRTASRGLPQRQIQDKSYCNLLFFCSQVMFHSRNVHLKNFAQKRFGRVAI